jgi:hypothetical protein
LIAKLFPTVRVGSVGGGQVTGAGIGPGDGR